MTRRESNIISLYFACSGMIGFFNYFTYFSPSTVEFSKLIGFSIKGLLFVLSPIVFLGLLGLAYYIWRNPIKLLSANGYLRFTQGYYGGVFLLTAGLIIGLLTYSFMTYASFRLVFFWLILSVGLLIVKLVNSASDEDNYLFTVVFVFDLVALAIYGIQKFMFPLEMYWIPIAGGLLFYIIIEWLLIKNHIIQNIFLAQDQNSVQIRDSFLIFVGPVIIAFFLYLIGPGSLKFLLPVMWLICILQSCLTVVLIHLKKAIMNRKTSNNPVINKSWMLSITVVLFIYGLAFFSLKTYPPSNPLFEGGNDSRGIWFTVPVNKSELFPYGYGRLEDSIFDDLGKPFIAALGQTLGFVEKCEYPGPDTSVVIASPDPSTLIQPRYVFAVDSMCINWLNTLPYFFLRIGLLGLFLLSLVIGLMVKDPIDFGLLALLFLFGWFYWPVSEIYRIGNVAVLISGMALIGVILPLIRRNRTSFLIMWGIISGFMFGIAGFVRQPCGYALFVTSLVTLFLMGLKQKKRGTILITIASLLVGYSMVPAALNGMFIYRDTKLQITAPSISPRSHGSGFSLLGGIGGAWFNNPSSYEFKNQLDIAFKDPITWFNLYNENPMISFPQSSYDNLMLKSASSLFSQYITDNPIEYIWISIQKTFISLSMFNVSNIWSPMAGLLLFAIVFRYIIYRNVNSNPIFPEKQIIETIIVFFVLIVVAVLPAILTSPHYGESTYPSSAAFLFTGITTIYMLFKGLFVKYEVKRKNLKD